MADDSAVIDGEDSPMTKRLEQDDPLADTSKVSWFRYTFGMTKKLLARDELWDVATTQLGFVTAQQARAVGVGVSALQMLVQRGKLTRVAHGVYRFPQFPVSQYDSYMLAVLWTRVPEACLSHETALDAYEISDINPDRIHVTIAKRRRLRRAEGDDYVIHREDLGPSQIGWWQEIPTVTPETAIAQCIAYGTPTYLLRQAIDRGHLRGYLKVVERDELAKELETRHES
jgi:predicted transcriptional regulator of viral defense system